VYGIYATKRTDPLPILHADTSSANVACQFPDLSGGRFFEPLEKEISVEDMQKIVDANEKLVRELKDGTNTISK